MSSKLKIKIKILGVGGGGCNMIDYLHSNFLKDFDHEDIEVYAINTDQQVLDQTDAIPIIIGKQLTQGLGAGMKPDVGRDAALEDYQEIVDSVKGADMVFIATGLGGGTGTGAAPIVAKAVKESGALAISISTKPFMFEGKKRRKLAEAGLKELAKNTDALIVVENENLLKTQDKSLGMKAAFAMIDSVLAKAVQGIIGIVLESSKNDINVDFADLKTIMSYPGHSVMSMAIGIGEEAAKSAVLKALENPLLANSKITGSRGVLINFTTHDDYPLDKIYEAMNMIQDEADEDADIIFGTSTLADIDNDEVAITLIATGFSSETSEEEEIVDGEVVKTDSEVLRIKA